MQSLSSGVMSSGTIPIRWSTGSEDLRGALRVREQVFCGEQGVPLEEEHDGLDDDALHLVALCPRQLRVIGTLRLLVEGATARIGRVAMHADWRRRGVALQMLGIALDRAQELGCTHARLAAQLDAIELYRRAGFAVESDSFLEAGIAHVWMGRSLAPSLAAARRSGSTSGRAGRRT